MATQLWLTERSQETEVCRAPPTARAFVAVFLTAFVLCGVLGIEAWPLTGWRLFSNLRAQHQTSWQVVTFDRAGQERPLPYSRLPRRYRNFTLIMRDFPRLPATEQAAVCRTWADAVRQLGQDVVGVRIYQVERDLSRREDRLATATARRLRYVCGEQGGPAS
jgi:hypothetical protein